MFAPEPSTSSILSAAEHRPWPTPHRKWLWHQKWLDVALLHWSFPSDVIRALVPADLSLDLYDDRAWVSIVPFKMQDVYPRGFWPLPFLSNFLELNVRTYVVRDGKPGVYFLSIDAAHPIAAWLARLASPLHYRYLPMKRHSGAGQENFQAVAAAPKSSLELSFRTGKAMSRKSPRDLWLTERYCLYAKKNQQLYRAEVQHQPWELRELELISFAYNLPFSAQLHFDGLPEFSHYSPGVSILAWSHEHLR
ncbi:MAG: DUF2071 domain-containing protein [Proteobacteria bacterium]|nr:DUF2071 domain-containing protein [Pseudomonadota bacterium]